MGLFGESFSDKRLKYFINAIRAYFISGGKSELIAAFATAKTCGKRDRLRCIDYLNDMANEYLKEAEKAKENNDEKSLMLLLVIPPEKTSVCGISRFFHPHGGGKHELNGSTFYDI